MGVDSNAFWANTGNSSEVCNDFHTFIVSSYIELSYEIVENTSSADNPVTVIFTDSSVGFYLPDGPGYQWTPRFMVVISNQYQENRIVSIRVTIPVIRLDGTSDIYYTTVTTEIQNYQSGYPYYIIRLHGDSIFPECTFANGYYGNNSC